MNKCTIQYFEKNFIKELFERKVECLLKIFIDLSWKN
jgi:hypothetical protein